MKKSIKKLWLKALRSGKYKQARKVLKSSNGGFCCLGVLCDLHQKETGKGKWTGGKNKHSGIYNDGADISNIELTPNVMHWAGLIESNPSCGVGVLLSEYNDGNKYRNISAKSFKEIADLIEESL